METSDAFAHIENGEVNTILKKAIQKAGGLTEWNQLASMKFQKWYALYTPTGAEEVNVTQQHHYQHHPAKTANISWRRDSLDYELQFDGNNITQSIDGEINAASNPESLKNTVFAATHVADLPFKLLDPTVQLTYEGKDTLRTKAVVDVIRADYNTDDYENHTHSDTWWFYFDSADATFRGYTVQHADHISYVENLSFHQVNGFNFVNERKSYRVDSARNILYLRAAYQYSNYELVAVQ